MADTKLKASAQYNKCWCYKIPDAFSKGLRHINFKYKECAQIQRPNSSNKKKNPSLLLSY